MRTIPNCEIAAAAHDWNSRTIRSFAKTAIRNCGLARLAAIGAEADGAPEEAALLSIAADEWEAAACAWIAIDRDGEPYTGYGVEMDEAARRAQDAADAMYGG